jgi:hypothetical protein
MYSHIQIDGDPTKWLLDQPIDASYLTGQTPRFQVKAPLVGTLLLSPKSAASVAVFDLPPQGTAPPPEGAIPPPEGAVPHDLDLPASASVIYVPTATGPSAGSVGYELPDLVDLADLADEITALMRVGRSQTITLGGAGSGGALVLNGATLSFVVLCRATAAAGGLDSPSGGGAVPHD